MVSLLFMHRTSFIILILIKMDFLTCSGLGGEGGGQAFAPFFLRC